MKSLYAICLASILMTSLYAREPRNTIKSEVEVTVDDEEVIEKPKVKKELTEEEIKAEKKAEKAREKAEKEKIKKERQKELEDAKELLKNYRSEG